MSVMFADVFYDANDSGRYLDASQSGYTASLYVSGTVVANGYRGKAGVNGAIGNTFNFQWDNPYAKCWVDVTLIGTIATLSDYRLKRNVNPMSDGALDRIKTLRPIKYQWDDYEKDNGQGGITKLSTASDDINEGFIAHELQEIIPSAVDGEKDDPVAMQSLRNDAISAVVVKALQELSEKVDFLKSEIEDQRNYINNLEQQITVLKNHD